MHKEWALSNGLTMDRNLVLRGQLKCVRNSWTTSQLDDILKEPDFPVVIRLAHSSLTNPTRKKKS